MRALRWLVEIVAKILNWLGDLMDRKNRKRRKFYRQVQQEYNKRRTERLMKEEQEMFY